MYEVENYKIEQVKNKIVVTLPENSRILTENQEFKILTYIMAHLTTAKYMNKYK